MKRQTFTILIAEDDANDQQLISVGFGKIGAPIKTQFVSTGEESIAYLKGTGEFADRKRYEYPSFIVTDLKMPNGDGLSVLEFLKSTPEFAIIPTVVLSASVDPDDVKQSYALGASAYLQKPTKLEDLVRLIQVLVDFWMVCEVPEVDLSGKQLKTEGGGKLGQRFRQ